MTFCNKDEQKIELAYTEAVTANYEEIQYQSVPHDNKKVKYSNYTFYDKTNNLIGVNIYDYDWGIHASARDNFQHALPLIYYNQQLARSVLRYMLKRTTAFGDIRLVESGHGYASNERYFTSDQQLFFFMLISEYLRVSGDYAFLKDEIEPYPATYPDSIADCL